MHLQAIHHEDHVRRGGVALFDMEIQADVSSPAIVMRGFGLGAMAVRGAGPLTENSEATFRPSSG